MMNNFFLIGLPYIAMAIFLIGTIYRYTYSAFKFSSLSSQLLEGRDLYKGSRPFHWGIIAILCGHLIGFLFPAYVIAWNGKTVRLLILEMSAFGFALCALYGIIVLIYRRLKSKRLMVVTSRMDFFVYAILVVQITSGLWIAYFNRWGSSWFATVMGPYLWSIVTFSPDASAVTLLPFSTKIHFVSAFTLIAMTPFTRFIHFLVYPWRYFYRNYQRVIWNWDRKTRRHTTVLNVGIKAKNN